MHTTAAEDTRPAGNRAARVRVGIPLAVFALAFVAAWFRIPAASRDTFWAEDARLFSARMIDTDLMTWSVFTPYDGYVHVLPHAIAFLLWHVLPIPVALMAQAFTAAACVVAAAVAAGIFLLTGGWGLSLLGRLLLAFTTVLVPGLGFEIVGNLANVHWLLLWLAPFVFLARPARWWTASLLGIVAFVILTTEVQAVLFTPLLLWRIADRRRWPMIAGAAVGVVVQAVAVLAGGRSSWGEALPTLLSVALGYLVQVPLVAVTGSASAATEIVSYAGWIAALAALVPFAACAVWWAWGSRRRALLAVGVFAASVVIWSAGYALNVSSLIDFPRLSDERLREGVPLLRYAVVPMMLLFALVALAVGRVRWATAGRVARIGTVVAIAGCVAAFALGFRHDPGAPRASGPTWTEGLAAAEVACADADPDAVTDIWIAPSEFWRFPVACGTVQEWARE